MSITIVNEDGSALGTKILNDDGIDICEQLGIGSMEISIVAGEVNKAKITLGLIKTRSKIGKVEWLTRDPIDGQFKAVSSIMFTDGNSISFDDDGEVRLYSDGDVVKFPDMSSGRLLKFRAP